METLEDRVMNEWKLRKDAGWDKPYSDGYADGQRKLLEHQSTELKREMSKETLSAEVVLIFIETMLKELEASQ